MEIPGYLKDNPLTGKHETTGDLYAYGITSEIGNTQSNQIDIALSNTVKVIQGKQLPFTLSESRNSEEAIINTFAHEVGHAAGLRHPWDPKNDVPDIDNNQDGPGEAPNSVRNNLLNSEGNPNKQLQAQPGSDLTPGQRKKINDTIDSQAPSSNKKPTNK